MPRGQRTKSSDEGPRFNTGDIVQLKSGGPRMTVAETDQWGVTCQWFAGSKLSRGKFREDQLEVPPAEEKAKK
jgi:uncharacterized protein YodC (DUF2158 family)